MNRRLTVVIADDHPVFLEGLVSALEDRGIQVSAAVADGEQALEAVEKHQPDIVLMDLVMPGMGGIEATRQIAVAPRAPAVLVLTMSADDESVFAALRAGAQGYLLKESAADDIVHAVTALSRGEAVLGARVSKRVLAALSSRRQDLEREAFPQLTSRESEVLALIALGLDNARIAKRLLLSEKTVRNHVSTILAKLPARSRAEAVAAARDAGLGR